MAPNKKETTVGRGLLDGSGIYSTDIEDIFPNNEKRKVIVPQIEEIRALFHEGEVYLNARDVVLMLQKMAKTDISASASVRRFILNFITELITQ